MDLIMAESIECFMDLHQNPLTLCNLLDTLIQIDVSCIPLKKFINHLMPPSL